MEKKILENLLVEFPSLEAYDTGTGQHILVHSVKDCEGHCAIHNPSDHVMYLFPNHWNGHKHIMERLCPHGIYHPDPDDIKYRNPYQTHYQGKWDHNCDGCCIPLEDKIFQDEEYID